MPYSHSSGHLWRRSIERPAKFKLSRPAVASFIFDNLNELFFEGRVPAVEWSWLPPKSFHAASRSHRGSIQLHPALFEPRWKLLLEYEIYRGMLRQLDWPEPKGVNSLEFRRAEGRIGNVPQRLESRLEFVRLLYRKFAKQHRLKKPQDATLLLYVCARCGSGAARLNPAPVHCEWCRLKKPVIMKLWDTLSICQHYKGHVSPEDYAVSELTEQPIPIYQDSFLTHFLE